jgi:hypothetical protein
MPRLSLWFPRILAILFALFLSVFALDVFAEPNGFWPTLLALLMHLVPSAIVVLVLAIAWRWEALGATLFCALGIVYLLFEWGRFAWTAYAFIAGPLILIGALFLADWLRQPGHLHHA